MAGPILVNGFHGTSVIAAEAIVIRREPFRASRNEYDWLGDGAYFFQDAPQRAREWGAKIFGGDAAVVGARLRLDPEQMIDLLDIRWAQALADAYDAFLAEIKRSNLALPRQSAGAHRLDRAVLNYVVGVLAQHGVIVHAVRAAFAEGAPVFPNSAIFDRAHVQVAVRNPDTVIEELWVEPGGGLLDVAR